MAQLGQPIKPAHRAEPPAGLLTRPHHQTLAPHSPLAPPTFPSLPRSFPPDPIWIGAAGAPVPPTRSLSPSPTPPLDAHPQRRPAFLHSFPSLCWIRAIPIAPDPGSPALALTSASHRRPTATAFPDAPDPPAMEAPCARSFTSSRTASPSTFAGTASSTDSVSPHRPYPCIGGELSAVHPSPARPTPRTPAAGCTCARLSRSGPALTAARSRHAPSGRARRPVPTAPPWPACPRMLRPRAAVALVPDHRCLHPARAPPSARAPLGVRRSGSARCPFARARLALWATAQWGPPPHAPL
nr:vegetative cell wall protein gp1-like [Aegilops tauschii subsp. strangulata]